MKVLLLTPLFLPFQGGISVYVDNLATKLSNKGDNVTVLAPNFFQNDNDFKIFKNKINYELICLNAFKLVHESYISFGLLKYLLKLKYDVIHVQLIYPYGVELALLVTKLIKKVPIIATLHNYRFDNNIITKIYEICFQNRYFSLFSQVIITTSHYEVLLQQIRVKNTTIIPVGISDVYFEQHEPKSIENGFPYLLFVGGLKSSQPHKRIKFLLDGFKEFIKKNPEYKLLIIGDGDLKQDYQHYCQEINIEKNVVFLGQLGNKELPEYYRNAKTFIFPSIKETFGIPILEALTMNTTVIAKRLPIYNDFITKIGKENLYLYNKEDEKLLSRTINRVITTKRTSSRKKHLIIENYSWGAITSKTKKIYIRALKGIKK